MMLFWGSPSGSTKLGSWRGLKIKWATPLTCGFVGSDLSVRRLMIKCARLRDPSDLRFRRGASGCRRNLPSVARMGVCVHRTHTCARGDEPTRPTTRKGDG
jgi:hypothetical protein